MERFRRGEAQILVGTTVVEVGVDVPEATVMATSFGTQRFACGSGTPCTLTSTGLSPVMK